MDKKTLVMVVVLAVLIVVAGVQAVQLTIIKNSASEGKISFSSSSGTGAPKTQQAASSPSAYSGMVGGC